MSNNQGDEDAPGTPPFSAQDALSFMQKMWNPLGIPMPGFGLPGASPAQPEAPLPFPNPAMMFAALDPAEIDRKIAELRIVENWLSMSLNMMQMSIKTLELQRASIEAFAAAKQSMHTQGASSKTKPGK
jgi:hypothetical protein